MVSHDAARRSRRAVQRVSDSISRLVAGQRLGVLNGTVTGSVSASQVTVSIAGTPVPMVYLGALPPVGAQVKVLLVDGSPLCLGVWPGVPLT